MGSFKCLLVPIVLLVILNGASARPKPQLLNFLDPLGWFHRLTEARADASANSHTTSIGASFHLGPIGFSGGIHKAQANSQAHSESNGFSASNALANANANTNGFGGGLGFGSGFTGSNAHANANANTNSFGGSPGFAPNFGGPSYGPGYGGGYGDYGPIY